MTTLRALVVAATLAAVAWAGPAAYAGGLKPLPSGTDVDYQLGGPARMPSHVGIIERDRTDRPLPGRYNICYVNGFQTQDYQRRFWLHRHPHLLLRDHGRPVVDESWGEFLLDIGTPAKRRRLAAVIGQWTAGCARHGFDAVEYDNLDSFTRSHGLLSRHDAIHYARLLVRAAHASGLAAGQKNLAGFDGTRVGYDFAVAEECGRYHECSRYVRHYGASVLMIEYRAKDFARTCSTQGAGHAVELRDLDLTPGGVHRWC